MQTLSGTPVDRADIAGADRPFQREGLLVEVDNVDGTTKKRQITLFVRRSGYGTLHAHALFASTRAGRTETKRIRSESDVVAVLFRYVENGRTQFTDLLEAPVDRSFSDVEIAWQPAGADAPDSYTITAFERTGR